MSWWTARHLEFVVVASMGIECRRLPTPGDLCVLLSRSGVLAVGGTAFSGHWNCLTTVQRSLWER